MSDWKVTDKNITNGGAFKRLITFGAHPGDYDVTVKSGDVEKRVHTPFDEGLGRKIASGDFKD